MKILFLDQSGELGGAELCLFDIAQRYRDAIVCLFVDGPFRQLLEQHQIPVQVLAAQSIQIRKNSSWMQGLGSLGQLLPLAVKVAQISRDYDVIYANTQKALVVGALASSISRRPLVYHLHDILSLDHFSRTNQRLAVTLANRFAAQVIATSKATQAAFVAAGGRSELVEVVYNGFDPQHYQPHQPDREQLRRSLDLEERFVVGHFSRLSPWKGQHVLLDALHQCPEDVVALLVGDALFGEQDYAQALHAQATDLGLQTRVRFLGFRSDIVPLMHLCDLVAHTSTAPEPFGRVIVEAMLCGRPTIAAEAGGVVELVEPDVTGWLVPPGDAPALAEKIIFCRSHPDQSAAIAQRAQQQASQRFHIDTVTQQIDRLLNQLEPHQSVSGKREWRISDR